MIDVGLYTGVLNCIWLNASKISQARKVVAAIYTAGTDQPLLHLTITTLRTPPFQNTNSYQFF